MLDPSAFPNNFSGIVSSRCDLLLECKRVSGQVEAQNQNHCGLHLKSMSHKKRNLRSHWFAEWSGVHPYTPISHLRDGVVFDKLGGGWDGWDQVVMV